MVRRVPALSMTTETRPLRPIKGKSLSARLLQQSNSSRPCPGVSTRCDPTKDQRRDPRANRCDFEGQRSGRIGTVVVKPLQVMILALRSVERGPVVHGRAVQTMSKRIISAQMAVVQFSQHLCICELTRATVRSFFMYCRSTTARV